MSSSFVNLDDSSCNAWMEFTNGFSLIEFKKKGGDMGVKALTYPFPLKYRKAALYFTVYNSKQYIL